MKIHIFPIVRYIFVFALITLFILIFKQNYLVFLLFPYALLPIITIPLFLTNVNRVSVTGGTETAEIDVFSNIEFYAEYHNPTKIPFLKCSLMINVSNLFFNNDSITKINFSMLPEKQDKIRIKVATGRTGMAVLKGTDFMVTDFLGIMTKHLPSEICIQVPVFPIKGQRTEAPEIPFTEGYDEYSEPDIKGSISSDVREIREYRAGDRITQIHWKLSSKMDDLMVKEMERTSVMSLVVVPELEKEKISETIETLDSVARTLAEDGERFEICLYNAVDCSFDYYLIDSTESLFECYRNMYFLPLYDSSDAAYAAYVSSGQKSPVMLIIHGNMLKLIDLT